MPKSGYIHRQEEVQRFYRMAATETDINEDLKTLAQDAENARLYGSPPDAIVMRAIELGKGTRAELRRATGFGYDVIEKCLERLGGELRSHFEGEIEHFQTADAPEIVKGVCVDCGGPRSDRSWERCQKCHTAKIHNEQRAASPSGQSAPASKVEYICVDCGGPRSYGSGQRCKKCYDAKGVAGRRPPKPEVDAGDQAHKEAQQKIEQMVARGKEPPEITSNGDSVIHESVKSGYEVIPAPPVEHCFCGREQPVGGKHRGTHRNKAAKVDKEAANEPSAHLVSKPATLRDSSTSLMEPNPAMAQVQVMGGVKLHNEIEVRVSEMAHWPAERITEFFDALAKVVEIPQRPMPKTIKRAWSKDFEEDQGEEGIAGLSMLYLVSILHDGMEENEKQAVWTLIQYLKRMQAALEVA